MKRIFNIFLLLLLLSDSLLFADWDDHSISGVIGTDIVFEVTTFEENLPFDLDDDLVDYNPTDSVKGLRIGTYTFVSHSTNVKLKVHHDALTHETNQNSSINYRLYLMTEVSGLSFVSSTNDLEILGTAVQKDGFVSLVDKYMYVTLDEGENTDSKRAELEKGRYESTISFSIWVQ